MIVFLGLGLIVGLFVAGVSAAPRESQPRSSSFFETCSLSTSERVRRADVRQAFDMADDLLRDSERMRAQLRQRVVDAYAEFESAWSEVDGTGLLMDSDDERIVRYGAACSQLRHAQYAFEEYETINLGCWDRRTRLNEYAL